MATIINNYPFVFTAAQQQEIQNAAAHAGIDGEIEARQQKGSENLFNFMTTDEDGDPVYHFSLDVEGDVIWHNQYVTNA